MNHPASRPWRKVPVESSALPADYGVRRLMRSARSWGRRSRKTRGQLGWRLGNRSKPCGSTPDPCGQMGLVSRHLGWTPSPLFLPLPGQGEEEGATRQRN
jgi:hypothetical protein